ncbi:hypothetical protein ACFL0U_00220 [Pseudomonadota bacterium]
MQDKIDKWNNIICNDIAKQYDIYYTNGEKSLYNLQFSKVVIPTHDQSMLIKSFKKSLKEKKKFLPHIKNFRIFDFGCGNGRLHPVLEKFGKYLKKNNFSLELVLYDISKVGLETYEKFLIEKGYKYKNKVNYRYKKNIYFGSTLVKNNILVKIIMGTEKSSTMEIEKFIKNVDVSICMYDIINHIPLQQKRIKIINLLGRITNYDTVFTVATKALFKKEQKIYEGLRKQGFPLKMAINPGDLYYTHTGPNNESIYNFFHVYNSLELINDFKKADMIIRKFGIAIITNYTKINCGFIIFKLDEIISKITTLIVPKKYIHNIALDIAIIARKRR